MCVRVSHHRMVATWIGMQLTWCAFAYRLPLLRFFECSFVFRFFLSSCPHPFGAKHYPHHHHPSIHWFIHSPGQDCSVGVPSNSHLLNLIEFTFLGKSSWLLMSSAIMQPTLNTHPLPSFIDHSLSGKLHLFFSRFLLTSWVGRTVFSREERMFLISWPMMQPTLHMSIEVKYVLAPSSNSGQRSHNVTTGVV